jgi:hypothetical protein
MSFQDKYLKYKKKYDLLKKQIGGIPIKDSIKELNKFSFPKSKQQKTWIDNATKCENEKYGLKSSSDKTKRLNILIRHLEAFCNDKIPDLEDNNNLIKIVNTPDIDPSSILLKYLTEKNLSNSQLNNKVKMLFNAINTDIDINAQEKTPTIKFSDGYHFVVGSSQMKNPTNSPVSVADALVNILYENKKDNIITFGTKESNLPNHFKWNLIADDNFNFDNVFEGNPSIISNDKGITIYFTYGAHEPPKNIKSIDNFYKSVDKSKQIKQLRENNKLRLIVTGTDAVNPSTNTTCYKVAISNIGYSLTKLYQLVKCACLVSNNETINQHLTKLSALLGDGTNLSNILKLHEYDTLATEILSELDKTPNFSWAKNLTVMLTNMHISRFIDYSNINIPINKELIPAVLNGSMTNIEAIKNKITSDILFRGRNMITIRQAALEHIHALNEIK